MNSLLYWGEGSQQRWDFLAPILPVLLRYIEPDMGRRAPAALAFLFLTDELVSSLGLLAILLGLLWQGGTMV